jgi:TRAP-type transport system periplasmic protein
METKKLSRPRFFVGSFSILSLLLGLLITSGVQAEPSQLTFFSSTVLPKSGRFVNCYQPWFESIEKATNGAVKINILTKYSGPGDFTGILNGDLDLSMISASQMPQFPLTMTLGFPGAGLKDTKMASFVAWNIYKKLQEIQKEFDQVQVLFAHAYAPMLVAAKYKPVRTPKDLSGQKTWIMPPDQSIVEAAGGLFSGTIPLQQTGAQMEDGKIDAIIVGWEGQSAFGGTKAARFFAEIPAFGGPSFFIVMNKAKWKALPADVQQAILSVSGDKASRMFGEGDAISTEKAKEFIRSQGDKQLIALTPEEQAQWIELVKPFMEKKIAEREAKGLPARSVYNEMLRLVKEYK